MSHASRPTKPSALPGLRLLSPALGLLALTLAGCGKVGAPVPPGRITERTSDLNAVQVGSSVLLSWPVPPLGRSPSSRSYVARADIYRLVERRSEDPILDVEDFEETAELIGYLDRASIQTLADSQGRLSYTDALDMRLGALLADVRLRYAIRYVNTRGQRAAFSNTVAIEPVASVSLPPSALTLQAQAQDALTIGWISPEANVDGSRPAKQAGFNVYRRTAKSRAPAQLLNPEPVNETSFTDRQFRYEVEYLYTVRALSQGRRGLIESEDSESLAVTPVDTFPPSSPNPVSIASANGVISLFWPRNPERDVAGYRVYRSDSRDVAHADWVLLNAQLLTTVTFRDDRVEIGRSYGYKVTAVDEHGNEGKPSDVVTETAHP